MRQSYRLEHAPKTVTQMKAEKADGEDVPGRNPPDLKSGDYVLIDIPCDELSVGMDVSSGEMQEVEDDENKDDGAAPVHGARGVGGDNRLFAGVADGPGRLAPKRELKGGDDVQKLWTTSAVFGV